MNTLTRQIAGGGWQSRSVLERSGKRSATPLWRGLLAYGKRRRHFVLPAQFKTWRLVLAAFIILHSAFCLRAWGQSYSLDWSTIDGGGGASTGGVYTVSGTIGQPDAGTMSGGTYTLSGGFWGMVAAVQTPGAPLLSITHTETNSVLVSWPLPADGWVLEWTNKVAGVSVPWPQVSPPYQTNTTQAWITVAAPTGNRFYRLHKP
jgi:hypothetical protein